MGCIRVRFVADGSFVGKAIRWVTNSLFQHVEFGAPEGTWIGAHNDGGIQERPANYCAPTREYVYEIPCTDEQQTELLKWVRSKIGMKYDFDDIAGLLFHDRHLDGQGYICSEFCCVGLLMIFGASKVLNVREEYAYLITPETLHLSPIFVGRLVKRVG